MTNTATLITICVFTGTSKTKVFEYDTNGDIIGYNFDALTSYEYAAHQAVEEAANAVLQKYPDANIQWWLCPYDYDVNPQAITQAGFGMNLPAILINGYFEDSTRRQYKLKNWPGGVKTWEAKEVHKYIRAMYENDFGDGNQSIVCKLFPALCDVGAYLWLGLAGLCVYKAMEVQNTGLKLVWGTGAVLAADAFANGKKGQELIEKALGGTRSKGIDCNCNKVMTPQRPGRRR